MLNDAQEVCFMRKYRISLQHKIMLLTIGSVCLALLIAGAFVIHHIYREIEDNIGNRALQIGRSIAGMPEVRENIRSAYPSAVLQPIAEQWRMSTGAAFIVISNMDQIRLSHPNAERLGTPLSELYRDPVLSGQEYLYIAKGSLAPSLRANVPIYALEDNRQIGFVSVGFYVDEIYNNVLAGGKNVLYALLIGLVLSIAGSALVAENIKKAIYGLEPYEIATMLKEKEATLDALREGVVAVDIKGMIRLVNNEAAAIIGKNTEEMLGQPAVNFIDGLQLESVIGSKEPLYDHEQRVNDIIILANIVPIIVDGQVTGAVIAFRDRTEISRLAEEMTGVHRFVDLLRAQAHEFKNKLHAVAGLIQLGEYEQAVDVIIDNYAGYQGEFENLREAIKDTVTFGLLMGKMSRARELGIAFSMAPDSRMGELPGQLTSGDMVIILGNLIENAMEAVLAATSKKIVVSIREEEEGLEIRIENSGPCINESLGDRIYARGVSDKGAYRGFGLALVAEKVKVNNGTICHCSLPQGGVEFKVWIPYYIRGESHEED